MRNLLEPVPQSLRERREGGAARIALERRRGLRRGRLTFFPPLNWSPL